MSGEFYIPASAFRAASGHALLATDGLSPRTKLSADDNLTTRQCEVAAMLADGKSNKEIARELNVFEGTIKLHVKGILRKLGVRNRTEAVLAAARAGYFPERTLGIGPSTSECPAGHGDHGMPGASAASPPLQPEANNPQPRTTVSPAGLAGSFGSRRA
jgi:DNA-binding CsgD family transcriptional regulator